MERRGTMGNNKKSRELRDAGKHKKRHYTGEEGRCRRQGEEVGQVNEAEKWEQK